MPGVYLKFYLEPISKKLNGGGNIVIEFDVLDSPNGKSVGILKETITIDTTSSIAALASSAGSLKSPSGDSGDCYIHESYLLTLYDNDNVHQFTWNVVKDENSFFKRRTNTLNNNLKQDALVGTEASTASASYFGPTADPVSYSATLSTESNVASGNRIIGGYGDCCNTTLTMYSTAP